MKLEDRGMARREFTRITRSELFYAYIETAEFSGYAGVLHILGTDGIWEVKSGGSREVIAAPGYTWLQLAPRDAGWWLTVMYDVSGNLVQYYFDIVDSVYLSEKGEPRFKDLFLDIVMLPDGTYALLDRDELDSAFSEGRIKESQYKKAWNTARKLIDSIEGKENHWRKLCSDIMTDINRRAEE